MNIDYKKLFVDIAKEHYENVVKKDTTSTYTGKKLKPATRRKKHIKGGLKNV